MDWLRECRYTAFWKSPRSAWGPRKVKGWLGFTSAADSGRLWLSKDSAWSSALFPDELGP